MDAPDDSVDLLELSIAVALRSRSIPIVVVGELWVVRSASALASAPSSAASATSPPPTTTALATHRVVSRVVPGESAAVAGSLTNPIILMLRTHGEALHLAAVLEQVVPVMVDVIPWIFFTLGG